MTLSLLAISGSLRKDSYNTKLLTTLDQMAGERAQLQLGSLTDIPLFNSDQADPAPPSVTRLKDAIARADGVIIATPEYNYGIPGVLKNALDWVSRPAYRSVLAHKAVAILGASLGPVGTARAQGQLKQVLLGMVSDVFSFPEVTVGSVGDKFDDEGELQDERTRKQLDRLLSEFCAFLDTRAS